MERIGDIQAQSHFEELLNRVEGGESIAVIRDGRHVATLVPAQRPAGAAQAAFERLAALRERLRKDGRGLTIADILQARDEGRK